VSASEKEPEGWTAADELTLLLGITGHNDTELSGYLREGGSSHRSQSTEHSLPQRADQQGRRKPLILHADKVEGDACSHL
jgi:transposase